MVTKEKNELRAVYDNAKQFYSGIASAWKKDFMTDAEYQSFMKTYSYVPNEDVPLKFHQKIQLLRNMISNQAQLVREQDERKNILIL